MMESNQQHIKAMLEGGIGDYILATRFLAAIKDKYPEARLTVYSNNDNNEHFDGFFERHWGYLCDNFVRGVTRKSDKHVINSQFGQEVHNAAFANISDNWSRDMLACHKFYNLHLDGLHFLDWKDIPWIKYLKCVPTPRGIKPVSDVDENTIVVNLYAREGHSSGISKEKSDAIIDNLRASRKVVILAATEEVRDTFYEKHKDLVRVTNLDESLDIIAACGVGIAIDTGMRCMFQSLGKTCYTFCCLCPAPQNINPSHYIRWYAYSEHLLPLDAKPLYVAALVENTLDNPVCGVFPSLQPAQIDQALIRRRYA